ncbi:MAG: hypothetical protein PHE79_01950 [Eubacteriales bacterium]|nr:hypothetical protein [Eubacteriales bacterium]
MITDKVDVKRNKFKMLLFRLAESQKILSSPKEKSDIYIELESIYSGIADKEEFRHYYSDIFAVISQVDKDPQLGNTEVLNQNMNLVRQGYQPQNKDPETNQLIDISKQINKLYDHINLDIARLNYFKTIESRSQSDLNKVNETLEQVGKSVSLMQDNVEKADDMQKQYVTILGIFAAIVLTFTGGIAFSTSVLENIGNASVYKIVLIAVGVAFVLINIIYILTRFILEINKKENEVIKYPKFMLILNLVCVCVVSIVIVSWFFDVGRAAEIFRNLIYQNFETANKISN